MFGPNTYFEDKVKIEYSHRDKIFFDLFTETRELFSKKFNLEDYDVLFVPGSGTIGIESLFYSLKYRVDLVGVDGTFKNRWTEMEKGYANKSKTKKLQMCVLYETSCSTHFYKEGCIVDAISAFPYYDIPKDTKAFVTCLNKQLGSYVGLAVVCIRKDFWDNLIDSGKMSYLNLARYKEYHDMGQAPSTSPTYIYEHFHKHLQEFDLQEFRKRIDYVSDLIVDTVGEENIIGDRRGPAITLKNGVIPEKFAREHDVYGYWAGRPNYQMFTYTDEPEQYEKFLKELKQVR